MLGRIEATPFTPIAIAHPNLTLTPGRPNLKRQLESAIDNAIGLGSGKDSLPPTGIAVGVCGPRSLADSVVQAVADVDGAMNEKACDRFVIDSCKNIYFAGHETTATTISWSLMLLAVHPEWQDRIRAEILEFCGDRLCHRGSLDFDTLRKLKVVSVFSF